MPAATYLARHGILVNLMDAGELLYYGVVPEDCAVVALSRSGRTAETARLAAKMKSQGVPLVAITNCPSSDFGKAAEVPLWISGDLDHGVSIQTYTGGVLTGLYLAASLTDAVAEFDGEVESALASLGSRMEAWQCEVDSWRLGDCSHFFFLGRGYSLSSACESALLMQELARRPASWCNAAEFRQGPVEALHPGHVVVIFAPEGPTQHLNESLAADLLRTGAQVIVAGRALGAPEYLAPVLQIVPVQMAAYAIAAGDVDSPGQFRYAPVISEKEDGLAAG